MSENGLALRGQQASTLPAANDWQTMLSMADVLCQSGLMPSHVKTPAAAVAVIQKGRELGIPPMYALSNIAVIQGKPTANAELMAAMIYRDHGDDALIYEATGPDACTISYKRRTWPERKTYTFDMEDAEKAGLLSNQTWQKYPAAMLRARCVSAVARLAFPDTIGGLYTPEELGATVEVDAEGVVQYTPPPAHVRADADGVVIEQGAAPAPMPASVGFANCAECGKPLTKGQSDYSNVRFGRPLCPTHQAGGTGQAPEKAQPSEAGSPGSIPATMAAIHAEGHAKGLEHDDLRALAIAAGRKGGVTLESLNDMTYQNLTGFLSFLKRKTASELSGLVVDARAELADTATPPAAAPADKPAEDDGDPFAATPDAKPRIPKK